MRSGPPLPEPDRIINASIMKKLILFYSLVILGLVINAVDVQAAHLYADTSGLPECIKKLIKPATKGIRASSGARQYQKMYTLANGKKVYAFYAQPSIGCNINEPASVKYYDESCKLAASFPLDFSLKKGFKPYISADYQPEDFSESAQGEYPLYFANLKKNPAVKTIVVNNPKPKDPFPVEKTFKIGKADNQLLNFKTGDVIRVSTKSGLKHYRNQKLLNNYKLIPQQTIITVEAKCKVPPCFKTETNELVYYLGAASRFIDIRGGQLLTSALTYQDNTQPTIAKKLQWKTAYQLNQ